MFRSRSWLCSWGAALAVVLILPRPGVGEAPLPEPGSMGDGRLETVLEGLRDTYDLPALAGFILAGEEVREIAATGRRAVDQDARVSTEDAWHLGRTRRQ